MAKLIWSAMQAVLWIGVGFMNHAIGQETPIRHVVFIVKENRSFDHMFGRFPGANGATHGKISTGQILPLAHAPDAALNYGHGWVAAHDAMRSEEHTSELQSRVDLVCRLLLAKKQR